MLVALNSLLAFLKMTEFKLKLYKTQKPVFCDESRELTKEEYKRLLHVALDKKNEKLYYLLQTICGTGIRVSEHKYITVEALKKGKAIVHNKGKTRTILIPKKLANMLLTYCKSYGVSQGSIFVTKNGIPLNRSNIWHSMKTLCKEANVNEEKVFPHNLRHLFARTYYNLQRDVVRLADILGHSSIDTTRIYTITSTKECEQSLSKMNLIEYVYI